MSVATTIPMAGSANRKTLAATAREIQYDTILAALRLRPHTTQDLRRKGIFQPGARIKELREQGYRIETERVTVFDPWGFPHPRVALYTLTETPQ